MIFVVFCSFLSYDKIENKVRRKKMKKYKTTIKNVIIGMVLATLFISFGHFMFQKQSAPKISTDLISEQLKSVADLTTLEYHYTNIGKFENNKDFNGWNIPLTTKEFILSYDGVIKAGIDLDQLDIQVENQKIIITLPEAKIMSHTIEEDSIQLFNESKNIFNPISINDYVNFTQALKEEKEADLQTKGFLNEAYERAKATLTSLVNTLGEGKFSVEFK